MTKKKSNVLTGVDPESIINMRYCEAAAKERGEKIPGKKQTAKKPTTTKKK